MRACFIAGCQKPVRSRGMCEMHYARVYRHGDPTANKRPELGMSLAERFWSHVDKRGECWLWTANVNDVGYGRFSIDGALVASHRVAWQLERGEIPGGMVVDHLCGVRRCVNPDHLEPVSQGENVHRQARQQTHCVNGHSLADARIYRGHRHCRGCQSERYVKKGRPNPTHCVNGHEFTTENTRIYRGVRICKACRARIAREQRARQRA